MGTDRDEEIPLSGSPLGKNLFFWFVEELSQRSYLKNIPLRLPATSQDQLLLPKSLHLRYRACTAETTIPPLSISSHPAPTSTKMSGQIEMRPEAEER